MTTGCTPSESTLRRRAHKRGKRLVKISARSRWNHQYGPYMLTVNNVVDLYGLTLDDVAAELA